MVIVHLHEPAIFRREHERRRVAKICKTKMAQRIYFAIQHGSDFARIFFLGYSQCVAGRHRLRQPQIDILKQHRRCLAVSIQFGEHQRMECVMNRGRDLCGDDSVPLRVHHQNSRGRIKVSQIFCDT